MAWIFFAIESQSKKNAPEALFWAPDKPLLEYSVRQKANKRRPFPPAPMPERR